MSKLRLYNTLTRKKEDFVPIDEDNIRMYVCGPTVYDYAHIGNARPVIVFDTLFRLLREVYGSKKVVYARNITDVDDKINLRAAKDYPSLAINDAIKKLTHATNAQFQADAAALGCLQPTVQPRATDHLEEMRLLIETLIARGHAYTADNHVLFSVPSMGEHPRYGALAKRPLDEMIAGARVDVASYKRSDLDFVLWKPSNPNEPGWDSPAGIPVKGRPGWHIECSAMSMATLLKPFGGGLTCDDPCANVFDIHGGGLDLIFPHHENEIAQSCSAFGIKRMANIWMHNGFLQVEGQKMSKSLGNFITIRQVLESQVAEITSILERDLQFSWLGLAARLAMLQTHYREPLNWTAVRLSNSSSELYRWYQLLCRSNIQTIDNGGRESAVIETLSDDLNTPNALTLIRRYYKEGDAQALGSGMALLGLVNDKLLQYFKTAKTKMVGVDETFINQKIKDRLQFIAERNWHEADKVRDSLAEKGIYLKDEKDPNSGVRITTWYLK